MAKLTFDIPKEDFESLIELINLGDDDFKIISEKTLLLPRLKNYKEVESALKEITSHYKVVLNLFYTFCTFDLKEEQFVNDLYDYYSGKIENPINKEVFQVRFLSLFSNKSSVRFSIKSTLLEAEADHIYHDARILTDIRPVFSTKEELDILGKVTINQLKIIYRRKNKYENFFVNLDIEDLESLKVVIERAINKTKILEEIKLNQSHE
jgi:hypothetical protein